MTSSFSNMVIAGQSLAFLQEPETFEAYVRELSAAGSRKISEAAIATAIALLRARSILQTAQPRT